MYQGACDRTTVFSPLTRACESPYSIPREHGGWRPDCSGRANGNFADEHGRCDFYYECKSGEYIGTYECTDGKMFNPIEGSCDDPNYVPYPCGDGEMPNVCLNKKNGLYLDIYGRCSHYFECRHEQFLGLSMCPAGAYNPERGDCDNSGLVAKPCGMKINPCEKKKDRYYADIESHCIGYYMCERGLMIAKFACQSGTMFNEDTLECEDVTTTPPPCGLAPDCKNTTDGRYPAMHRGSQFYYVCKDEIVDAIRACSLDEGGFVFDPIKRRCDFPRNVCRPLGTKILGW